jgi:opacity protein-like surface antigen
MKKKLVIAITAVGFLFGSNSATAQVEQGSFLIDAYVGAPTGNVWFRTESTQLDFTTVGSPVSFGGRLEYMVADNFGIGVDVNYATTGYNYTIEGGGAYDTTSMTYNDAIQGYTAKKLRAMLRLNYHFVQTEALDVYVGFGAGYKSAKREFTIDSEVENGLEIGTLIPVAVRLSLGGRYYFHPNIGVNFELGLGGGGILQAGLAIKI